MAVKKEELLHIIELANLKIDDDVIDKYVNNLEDILDFAEVLKNADISDLGVTVGTNENYNMFRKDEEKAFQDTASLIMNSKEQERGMFKIPKVL